MSKKLFENLPESMVFCYQNCSDLLWEKIVLVIEKIFKIYSNSESSEQFLVTECFLTCSWRFLIAKKLEQLEFKLEKIIGMQEKLENDFYKIIFVSSKHWKKFYKLNSISPRTLLHIDCKCKFVAANLQTQFSNFDFANT